MAYVPISRVFGTAVSLKSVGATPASKVSGGRTSWPFFAAKKQKKRTREAFTSELLRVEQGVGAKRMFKNVVLRWPICRA